MSIDFHDDPRGIQLRLLVNRAQYDRYVASEAERILLEAFEDVATVIASPTFRNLSQFEQTRTLQLFAEVNTRLAGGYQTLTNSMVDELSQYSSLEASVAKAQIAAALDTGSAELTATLGTFLPTTFTNSIASLAIQGNTLPVWFGDQLSGMSVATIHSIQQGLIQGMSPRQIAANVLGESQATDPLNQVPNVLSRAKRDATAITRTATTAVHNDAAQQSYKAAGKTVTESYRFVAVRDNRTTAQCRAADGQVFGYDDPKRLVPPLHFNCRSTTIAILADDLAKKLGIGDGNTTHSMQSYDEWLRGESNTEQNSILGPSRANLWRSGSLTLASAIDQDGRTLTLAQLRDAVAPREMAGVGQ